MGYPIVHFELMSKDEDQLQKFYSTVMGWKIGEDNPMKSGLSTPIPAALE